VEALAGTLGKYFALGITSGERGYYAGAPVVDDAGRILGGGVVKRRVDDLTKAFSKHKEQFLVSPEGVIFVSGSNGDLLRTLWPIAAEQREALLAKKQFGTVSFQREGGRLTFITRVPISVAGWSVVLLAMASFSRISLTSPCSDRRCSFARALRRSIVSTSRSRISNCAIVFSWQTAE